MKDYSAMSDDEIAMEIFLLNLCESARKLAISRGMNHHDVLRGGGEWSKYDPCNNPSDAWPIIQERGISLSYDGIDWIAFDIFTEIKASNNIETHAGKPLRAAMICYLAALDAEKCDG